MGFYGCLHFWEKKDWVHTKHSFDLVIYIKRGHDTVPMRSSGKKIIDFSNIFKSCLQMPSRIRPNARSFTMYVIWHLKKKKYFVYLETLKGEYSNKPTLNLRLMILLFPRTSKDVTGSLGMSCKMKMPFTEWKVHLHQVTMWATISVAILHNIGV